MAVSSRSGPLVINKSGTFEELQQNYIIFVQNKVFEIPLMKSLIDFYDISTTHHPPGQRGSSYSKSSSDISPLIISYYLNKHRYMTIMKKTPLSFLVDLIFLTAFLGEVDLMEMQFKVV